MAKHIEEEKESRHAHLLKPIRDLAENWNIDLATELLEFLEELDDITIHLENGQPNLNFAEAALVIQGSTLVYSKKVESLYALVCSTLNQLGESPKVSNSKRQSLGSAIGADEEDFEDHEPEFLLLDDTIVTSDNIDIKPSSELRKEVGMLESIPYSLASARSEGVSNSSGLKTLSCTVHPSGALLLDNDDAIRYREALDAQVPSYAKNSYQSSETKEAEDYHTDNDDGGYGGVMDDYDSPVQTTPVEESVANGPPVTAHRQSTESYFSMDETDPWERLDPHAASAWKDRAYKKGKTYKIPDGLLDEDGPAQQEGPTRPEEVEANLNRCHYVPQKRAFEVNRLGFGKLFFHEFSYVVKERLRSQRITALAMAKRSKLERELELRGEVQHEGATFHKGAADEDDFEDDDDAYFGGGDDLVDDDHDDQFDGGGFGNFSINPEVRALQFGESAIAEAPESYVDLVRVHVEKYVQSANAWASDSQLHLRVQDWKDRLGPVLSEQSHHPPFDIHNYGEMILSNLHGNQDMEQDGSESGTWDFSGVAASLDSVDPSLDRRSSTGSEDSRRVSSSSFASSSSVQPHGSSHSLTRFEVCRLFLASLQLANNGNVELAHSDPMEDVDDSEIDNWFFKVKLMHSTLMNKELEGFRAPSVARDLDEGTAKATESSVSLVKKKQSTQRSALKQLN